MKKTLVCTYLPKSLSIDDPKLRKLEIRTSKPIDQNSNGLLGSWVDGIGDQNNDGYPDFIVSAHHEQIGVETKVGSAYVIYGGDSLPEIAYVSERRPDRGKYASF